MLPFIELKWSHISPNWMIKQIKLLDLSKLVSWNESTTGWFASCNNIGFLQQNASPTKSWSPLNNESHRISLFGLVLLQSLQVPHQSASSFRPTNGSSQYIVIYDVFLWFPYINILTSYLAFSLTMLYANAHSIGAVSSEPTLNISATCNKSVDAGKGWACCKVNFVEWFCDIFSVITNYLQHFIPENKHPLQPFHEKNPPISQPFDLNSWQTGWCLASRCERPTLGLSGISISLHCHLTSNFMPYNTDVYCKPYIYVYSDLLLNLYQDTEMLMCQCPVEWIYITRFDSFPHIYCS